MLTLAQVVQFVVAVVVGAAATLAWLWWRERRAVPQVRARITTGFVTGIDEARGVITIGTHYDPEPEEPALDAEVRAAAAWEQDVAEQGRAGIYMDGAARARAIRTDWQEWLDATARIEARAARERHESNPTEAALRDFYERSVGSLGRALVQHHAEHMAEIQRLRDEGVL